MKKMRIERFVIGALFCALMVLSMSAKADEATALVCGSGEIQVCTEAQADGSPPVIMYRNGSPLVDCTIPSETGVRLECKTADEVCGNAEKLCENMGRRNDHWRWNRTGCSCDYHRSTPTSPTTPPATPSTQPPTTTTPTTAPSTTPSVTPAPPAQSGSATTCPGCNFQCTTESLQALLRRITFIEEQIDDGAALVLTEEEIRALHAEAESLREQANECRNEALAERATTLVAALDPYRPEFVRMHEHLDSLDFTTEAEGHFCTDSFWGVFTCIVLPAAAVTAAAILIPIFTADLNAYQD
ncbi:hypothetical protein KKD80_03555 [Patescibacteria group bacterium]|nr:hypothetical protein [Patescibacteria group bacterium]